MLFKYILCIFLVLKICAALNDNENQELEDQCGSFVAKSLQPLLHNITTLKEEIKLNNLGNKDRELNELRLNVNKYQLKIADNSQKNQLLEMCKRNIENKEEIIASYRARISDLLKTQPETVERRQVKAENLAIIEEQNNQIRQHNETIEKHLNEITNLTISLENSVGKESDKQHEFATYEIQSVSFKADTGFDCVEKSENSWTIVQQKMKHFVHFNDFNRSWSDFENGFNYDNGNFFLGLSKLHNLTKAVPHELLLITEDFDGKVTYAFYNDFKIASERGEYVIISLGEFCGNATDTMKFGLHLSFVTFDRNNIISRLRHCARMFNSGWWYGSCWDNQLAGNPACIYPKLQMLIRPKY